MRAGHRLAVQAAKSLVPSWTIGAKSRAARSAMGVLLGGTGRVQTSLSVDRGFGFVVVIKMHQFECVHVVRDHATANT